MALTPKELLAQDPVQNELLKEIEAHIDGKLRMHELRHGVALALSFADVCPGASGDILNTATLDALKQLYIEAGWRDVKIDKMHYIISLTCPRAR